MNWLRERLENLRYDHPGLYGSMLLVTILVSIFACFLLLPDAPLLRAVGVTGIQKRLSAATNGVYWSVRAELNGADDSQSVQLYGAVEGIDTDGKLIVSIPQGDKWIQRKLSLANTEMIDPYAAAQIVGSLRTENARFEIYPVDRAVVWIRNTPLNVKLIETGAAKPDPNPRTNIFDMAFASYYWSIANGTTEKFKEK